MLTADKVLGLSGVKTKRLLFDCQIVSVVSSKLLTLLVPSTVDAYIGVCVAVKIRLDLKAIGFGTHTSAYLNGT